MPLHYTPLARLSGVSYQQLTAKGTRPGARAGRIAPQD